MEARTLIMAHIQECDRKHRDVTNLIDDTRADVKRLSADVQKNLGRWSWAIIGLLITIIGYFLARFGLPGTH